ncbi:MAG TPA: TIGR02530 family flagellar biosynthesis protein [Thermotogota bacterium]|nr:TIGR02530 family flagellar biosynthesis protein [Thermotogota bacterium]HRW93798.1 TIGR02530 family flagellar biosynthesis protein [Thermotogota bacterium]
MADGLNINQRSTPLYGQNMVRNRPVTPDAVSSSGDFSSLVQQQLERQEEKVKISAHARQRMEKRNIPVDSSTMKTLDQVMQMAKQKGSRSTLAMLGNSAFILSVKDRTVVTVLNQDEMNSHFITNIDSVFVQDNV